MMRVLECSDIWNQQHIWCVIIIDRILNLAYPPCWERNPCLYPPVVKRCNGTSPCYIIMCSNHPQISINWQCSFYSSP